MIARTRSIDPGTVARRNAMLLGAALLALTLSVTAAPGAAAASVQEDPELTENPIYNWLERHRAAAYWVAPLLMVVVAILPIPAEIPAAMNGMLFGAIFGTAMTWGGAMVGAMISYELARCFGQALSRRFVRPEAIEKLESLQNTEAAVLLMLRFTPVVAFTAINWASGLLQIRRATFVWTTAVGILPGAIAFTASGSFMAVVYERYPGTVTAVVAVLCAALLLRVWWKQRAVPTP
jgi:uncharacterized membrane protein YdjX (TVP38/TMEM64 family)